MKSRFSVTQNPGRMFLKNGRHFGIIKMRGARLIIFFEKRKRGSTSEVNKWVVFLTSSDSTKSTKSNFCLLYNLTNFFSFGQSEPGVKQTIPKQHFVGARPVDARTCWSPCSSRTSNSHMLHSTGRMKKIHFLFLIVSLFLYFFIFLYISLFTYFVKKNRL